MCVCIHDCAHDLRGTVSVCTCVSIYMSVGECASLCTHMAVCECVFVSVCVHK